LSNIRGSYLPKEVNFSKLTVGSFFWHNEKLSKTVLKVDITPTNVG